MEFLVVRRPRIEATPAEDIRFIRENKQDVIDVLKHGDAHFASFWGGAGFDIQKADSEEELSERLMKSPLHLFYQFKVLALADQSRVTSILAETFKSQQVVLPQLATLQTTWWQSIP